ncbi:MAG: GGDEF and EAL domain-containing protein [Burkholderiaceae bacterium]|nr:GGDEF and EAL domain-containing protein [Burkholderiaceae bacterium]
MSREPSFRPILSAAEPDPAGRGTGERGEGSPVLSCEVAGQGPSCAQLPEVCESERRLRRAMWASGTSVWEWRAEGGLIRVDPFLLGGAEVNLPACSVEDFLQRLHPEDAQAAQDAWRAHREGQRADLEVVLRLHHDGRQRWLRMHGRAIERDARGEPCLVMGTLKDMTAEREAAEALQAMARALERMSRHDGLTDLPNRAGLEDYLAQRMAQGDGFALMQLDIDGVKDINDSYGHEAGDRLLRTAAGRLREVLQGGEASAVLARWSGSSFSMVLQPGSGETEVRTIAQGVIAAFALPFDAQGHPVSLQARIGAVLAPRDGATPVELLRKVDVATQAARGPVRNGLAFYGSDLEDDVQRRVRLFSLLRADAERNGFAFVAQPKVDRDGQATGAELLMRWPTEAFGAVSPAEFIPMAEKLGLIGLMGRHALHAAARLAARCAAAGQRLPVAVNLSPKQVLQPGLDRQLLVACERAGIEPALLEIELTESALLAGLDVVRPVLQRLRGFGFSLALDDFGTGYSSLSYLRQLPLSKVKIDRSFLLDIERDERALRMLEPMIRLCEVLGLSTVAEGVETPAQFEVLRRLGVPEFQGYHFARPLPVDEWAARVEAAGPVPIRLPG